MTITAARTLLRGALVAAVLLYAALLRLDAITQTYGPVTRPAWLHNIQFAREGPSLLRPARLRWEPVPVFPHRDGPPSAYRSDPRTRPACCECGTSACSVRLSDEAKRSETKPNENESATDYTEYTDAVTRGYRRFLDHRLRCLSDRVFVSPRDARARARETRITSRSSTLGS